MSDTSDDDRPDRAATEARHGEGAAGRHDALAGRSEVPVSMAEFARRRAELGLSYDDIANQLKFAPRLIEALEAGDFDALPGRTFARGMLRSYAKLLKIDPAPYLVLLGPTSAEAVAAQQAMALSDSVPFSEGGRHVNLVYTVFSALILVAVAFFAFSWYQEQGQSGKMTFVSPAQAPVALPAPDTVPQEAAAPAAPGPAVVPGIAPAAPQAKPEPAALAPVPAAKEATKADAAAANAKPAPLAAGKRRIVLRFAKESWVEIKGRNGQTLLSQLNAAGSETSVEGEPPFHLTIGNAPNVQVTYNDQPVDLKPHYKVDVARLTLE